MTTKTTSNWVSAVAIALIISKVECPETLIQTDASDVFYDWFFATSLHFCQSNSMPIFLESITGNGKPIWDSVYILSLSIIWHPAVLQIIRELTWGWTMTEANVIIWVIQSHGDAWQVLQHTQSAQMRVRRLIILITTSLQVYSQFVWFIFSILSLYLRWPSIYMVTVALTNKPLTAHPCFQFSDPNSLSCIRPYCAENVRICKLASGLFWNFVIILILCCSGQIYGVSSSFDKTNENHHRLPPKRSPSQIEHHHRFHWLYRGR